MNQLNRDELALKGIWVTQDKQQIALVDMSDSHLLNVAAMMINVAIRDTIDDAMIDDEVMQGGYPYVRTIEEALRDQPIYHSMNAELVKRNLVEAVSDTPRVKRLNEKEWDVRWYMPHEIGE